MKQKVRESRYNWTGGLNLSATQDTIGVDELLVCTNGRVEPSGAIRRRAGSYQLGPVLNVAAGAVLGIVEWTRTQSTNVKQYVAIANGKLYYSDGSWAWTEVTPASGNLSTTDPSSFAVMQIGGTSYLFIGSGSDTFTWDGTTLTKIDTVNSVPQASLVKLYGNRMFFNDNTGGSGDGLLYWSKIGDGRDATVGGVSDGGSALISAAVNEPLIALETLGSSLLIATRTGVARFTGRGSAIQLDADTFGVSDDIGPTYAIVSNFVKANPYGFRRVDNAIMMWTASGPYVVTEAGVTPLTEKLQLAEDASSSVTWRGQENPAYIGHNRKRSEIWFIYSANSDSGARTALVYNYAMQAWVGVMKFGFGITSVAEANINGSDTLIAGCDDGFVRELDHIGSVRDDDADDYTMTVQFAPFALQAGPSNYKSLRHVFVQYARSDVDNVPTVKVYPDGGGAVTATLIRDPGGTTEPDNLRFDVAAQGYRFVVEVTQAFNASATTDLPRVIGVTLEGSIMDRL